MRKGVKKMEIDKTSSFNIKTGHFLQKHQTFLNSFLKKEFEIFSKKGIATFSKFQFLKSL
jgi:hypothetical protein